MRMNRRTATANVPVNVLVLVLLVCGLAATMPAHAARRAPAAVATVTEIAKVISPETSIAGPGFSTLNTHIAWTGTDTAHHLNVATGPDGLHFPTKTTLPETSLHSPALAEAQRFVTSGIAVAWTGTDPNHSLNVQILPGGQKLTLQESSIAAPAITDGAVTSGQAQPTQQGLLLAWTGTDANHSLNVLPLTVRTGGSGSLVLVPGTKTVLPQFSSNAGPSLLGNEQNVSGIFVLGWSTRATQQLNLATSADVVHFTSALGSGLPQTSANAPQFIQPAGSSSGSIAWTGTDAAHHLNVQTTTQFPQFPDPANTKTVLPETALGAPGFSGGEIAWTGTDPAHHLNVATLQGL